jgi:hypothetical protein
MREWVSGDRLVEAALLVVDEDVPYEVIEEITRSLSHILRPEHEAYCYVSPPGEKTPVTIFGTSDSGPAVLPVCYVCPGVFTQLMPPSIALEFTQRHVQMEHANELLLWKNGQPWLPGDARLN